jgi:hypothetical protein
MLNFFRKKNANRNDEEKVFSIFDESTWCYATTKEFAWNGRSLPTNTFIKRKSELEVANFIGGFIKAAYDMDKSKPGILYIGRNRAITFLLEKLFFGISAESLHHDFFEYLRREGKNRNYLLPVSDDIKPIAEIYPKVYSMLKDSGLLESVDETKFDILDHCCPV